MFSFASSREKFGRVLQMTRCTRYAAGCGQQCAGQVVNSGRSTTSCGLVVAVEQDQSCGEEIAVLVGTVGEGRVAAAPTSDATVSS